MKIKVIENPHATDEYRYRAHVLQCEFGLVDASGPTPEIAMERARSRYARRWLGVEWVGMDAPAEAKNATSGQIAMNGYRFALWRQVGTAPRIVCWIMLNPSTADATSNDATMRRVCGYARRWGFGWVTVGNLWPYRATKPDALNRWIHRSDEGVSRAVARSDAHVRDMAVRAHRVVVAWGSHGRSYQRGHEMLEHLRGLGIEPYALDLTAQGAPVHPLRQAASLAPRPLQELRAREAA